MILYNRSDIAHYELFYRLTPPHTIMSFETLPVQVTTFIKTVCLPFMTHNETKTEEVAQKRNEVVWVVKCDQEWYRIPDEHKILTVNRSTTYNFARTIQSMLKHKLPNIYRTIVKDAHKTYFYSILNTKNGMRCNFGTLLNLEVDDASLYMLPPLDSQERKTNWEDDNLPKVRYFSEI